MEVGVEVEHLRCAVPAGGVGQGLVEHRSAGEGKDEVDACGLEPVDRPVGEAAVREPARVEHQGDLVAQALKLRDRLAGGAADGGGVVEDPDLLVLQVALRADPADKADVVGASLGEQGEVVGPCAVEDASRG